VASVGNTFTVRDAIKNNGRLVSIDDRVVARDTLRSIEPSLSSALPNLKRPIFEVRAGAGTSEIQDAVLAAVRRNGHRPVVHIPHGTYLIAETLTLPVSDVQLVGDGYGTILRWAGAGAGPVLRVKGPSKATVREIQIDAAAKADGVVIDTVDQAGSRVYMDQAQLRAGRQTNLFVNRLDNTTVQLEDVGYAYSPDAVSIKVLGGPASAAGHDTPGKTNIFSGASAGHRISYDVSAGAEVLVRDLWYESRAGPGFANLHDAAVFTIDGARVSSPARQAPAAFDINTLAGRVAILATHIDDRVVISGNGSKAEVLAMGIVAEQKSPEYFANAASPPARAALLNSRHLSKFPGIRSTSTANVGEADAAFVRTMLRQTRGEHARVLHSLPPGITDVRMFRVWVANGLNNVTLTSGPTPRLARADEIVHRRLFLFPQSAGALGIFRSPQ
jgi:hypothetical protein